MYQDYDIDESDGTATIHKKMFEITFKFHSFYLLMKDSAEKLTVILIWVIGLVTLGSCSGPGVGKSSYLVPCVLRSISFCEGCRAGGSFTP